MPIVGILSRRIHTQKLEFIGMLPSDHAERLSMRTIAAAILAVLVWVDPLGADGPEKWMVELTLDSRKIEGMPLAWNSDWVHLLGRDGQFP